MLNKIPNKKTANPEPKDTKAMVVLYNTRKKLIPIKIHEKINMNKVLAMFFSFLAFKIAVTGFVKISLTLSNKSPNNFIYQSTYKLILISE